MNNPVTYPYPYFKWRNFWVPKWRTGILGDTITKSWPKEMGL